MSYTVRGGPHWCPQYYYLTTETGLPPPLFFYHKQKEIQLELMLT